MENDTNNTPGEAMATPEASPSPDPSPKKKGILPLIIAFIVLLVIAVGWFLLAGSGTEQGSTPVGGGSTPTSASSEPQVLLGHLLDARVYEITDSGINNVHSEADGSVFARTHRNGVTVTARIPSENFVVELVVDDGQEQKVRTLSSMIATPYLSDDGSFLVYSRLNKSILELISSDDMRDWSIYRMDTRTGVEEKIDDGYGVYFLAGEPNTIMYSTIEGIATLNLDEGLSSVFTERNIMSVFDAAQVSPNGGFIALKNDVTGNYGVFTTDGSLVPLRLKAVGEVPRAFVSIGLGDKVIYGVAWDQETEEYTLWEYNHADLGGVFEDIEGTLVYTFTSDQVPYRLVP